MAKDAPGSPGWPERIRQLLAEGETFPLAYTHKLIGRNTAAFESGVMDLRAAFPELKLTSRRESAGGNHVAYTFELLAHTPERIVALLESTTTLPDLHVLL